MISTKGNHQKTIIKAQLYKLDFIIKKLRGVSLDFDNGNEFLVKAYTYKVLCRLNNLNQKDINNIGIMFKTLCIGKVI